jgi:hypothetical protein
MNKSQFLVFCAVIAALMTRPAGAHEIVPAIADISFHEKDRVEIAIVLNLEALIAGIEPQHDDTKKSKKSADYERLRRLEPNGLRAAFQAFTKRFLDGVTVRAGDRRLMLMVEKLDTRPIGDTALPRRSVVTIYGALPPAALTVTWRWDKAFGSSAVRLRGVRSRLYPKGKTIYSVYLKNGETSPALPISGPIRQSTIETFWRYLVVGFGHIVPKGLDHILFVIGLFLLSTRLRPLLWQVTGFTLAHTATLALGVYGVVRLSPAIVEPLIALSIVYVAVENVLTDRLTAWRPAVVFGFGLLHGLGFAGVLREIGLAPDQFVTGLVAFNIGVELGQLAVIALCFAAVGLWFKDRPWYRARITQPASILIAAIGAAWFIERAFWG